MTPAEYMAELNRRLLAHEDYRPGMLFVTSPPDAPIAIAAGYTWYSPDGVDEPMRSIAQRLYREVEDAQ
jgi:hypothetical protein